MTRWPSAIPNADQIASTSKVVWVTNRRAGSASRSTAVARWAGSAGSRTQPMVGVATWTRRSPAAGPK
ncbi:hypothetical protein [Frankia sp. Cj3]|uniref:hypothetical protein n=1 Tax=Frankia sp. Cj3 TaxID=2880976 RepID=UPI001EF6C248|nr:hypothetical protein [Frankia sp. Cj3]